MKSRSITVVATVLTALAVTLPVFAQVGGSNGDTSNTSASASVTTSVPTPVPVSTAAAARKAAALQQHSQIVQQRVSNGQSRGGTEIQKRIDSLNKLLSRIQGMKNLSASEIASFTTTIQGEISNMTTLFAKIQSDSSTTTLMADLKTIAPDYRIYMLIDPQISLLSAVDRVSTLASSMKTIQSKIQTRVSSDATLSANTTITADLADIAAKLSDATSQASAAQAEIANLVPDQGVQATMQSNTAALKDARSKIQAAQKDLQTARQDAGAIVKLILSTDKSLNSSDSAPWSPSTHTTTSVSTTSTQ